MGKHVLPVVAVGFLALTATAFAESGTAAGVAIELNKAEPSEGGCALSFVVTNGFGSDISGAVYETVLFDRDGMVERMTLFDFGALPAGRPRVRQFVVPDLACDRLGRILINGANRCEAGELGANACIDSLKLESRLDVEVIG